MVGVVLRLGVRVSLGVGLCRQCFNARDTVGNKTSKNLSPFGDFPSFFLSFFFFFLIEV